MNEHKRANRLRFECESQGNSAVEVASGQKVPKLKQKRDFQQGDKNSVLSETMHYGSDTSPLSHSDKNPAFRQNDEVPTFKQDDSTSHGGDGFTSGNSINKGSVSGGGGIPSQKGKAKTAAKTKPTNNLKAKNKAARSTKSTQMLQPAQDNIHVQKAQQKVDKIEGKLDKAREVLAKQKPYKPPSLIKQAGTFIAWRYTHRKIHQKIYEVERENAGTESAHKIELAAEGASHTATRIVRQRIRTRPVRRIRNLSKRSTRAKANHAYQKLLQDNPELHKKTLARFYHKQRLKLRYAQQARKAQQTAHGAKHGSSIITRATTAIKNAAVALVKKNPKVWLIIALFGLLLMLLQSCMAMFTAIGGSMGGVVGATSYLAEDSDIDDATVLYTRLEAELEYMIINAERDNPNFDEYRFSIGDISHNPLELIAFLTAVYNDFIIAEVQATLQEIFDEQYQLEFTPEVAIRTRTEEHTGSWTDEDGNTHTYTYTVIVEYEWHILNITLTSQSFRDVILSRMNEEQTERFHLLMLTHGNRQYLQSPFDFNWLPFVTSLYGYRIHPISGNIERHWGLDIGLAEGTPILSGQDGTVIFAADAGGYGLLVVIDNGEGLVSRYAHCSALYVSVGDEVVAGDIIARVGSTGQSTGAHLHLEVIKNGRHLNPLIFTVTNHHLDLPAPASTDDFITITIPLTANHYIEMPIITNHNLPVTIFTAFESTPIAPMSMELFDLLITEAESHLGTPYVFGANGPHAFDCSSFVCWVFTHSGVYHLPRTTAQGIFNQSTPIPREEAQSGDLIFFTGTFSTTRTVTHVGIYTGGGFMIHAGSPVGYAYIHTTFWARHFYSFGRLNWQQK
ncbi:MAG: peptidoglycan DD-metalloendopeptidase family protein [Defluviitaleaceae bacterium]|nr:peptidoglycan DD-metalloendopeptidase family protein [Defluviitaleaceae bacterium]